MNTLLLAFWISSGKTDLLDAAWYGDGELGESVYGEKADIRPVFAGGIDETLTAIVTSWKMRGRRS